MRETESSRLKFGQTARPVATRADHEARLRAAVSAVDKLDHLASPIAVEEYLNRVIAPTIIEENYPLNLGAIRGH